MEAIKNTLAENLGGPFHNLASADQSFDLDTDVPDLSGKVALVTGGSEGIGFGCTHTLLKHGISKLFVLSMRKEVMDEALTRISEELGADKKEKVVWLQCDLSDWEAVTIIAKKVRDQTDRLDILINSAARGIMTQQFAPTNGIDLHMAGNHIGHVVLTSHLLPLLKKTSEDGTIVRIAHMASNAHEQTPAETAFASVEELQKDYGPVGQYGR